MIKGFSLQPDLNDTFFSFFFFLAFLDADSIFPS